MPQKKKQTHDAGKMIRITQVRSIIGYEKKQREVVRGLGLRRIGHSVEVLDHPAMRGMIHKVRHIVVIEQ
jgi:large subunit ribosomal protein L30